MTLTFWLNFEVEWQILQCQRNLCSWAIHVVRSSFAVHPTCHWRERPSLVFSSFSWAVWNPHLFSFGDPVCQDYSGQPILISPDVYSGSEPVLFWQSTQSTKCLVPDWQLGCFWVTGGLSWRQQQRPAPNNRIPSQHGHRKIANFFPKISTGTGAQRNIGFQAYLFIKTCNASSDYVTQIFSTLAKRQVDNAINSWHHLVVGKQSVYIFTNSIHKFATVA